LITRVLDGIQERRAIGKFGAGPIRDTILWSAMAALGLVLAEVIGSAAGHVHALRLDRVAAPLAASKYTPFVATAVGAEAVFMALFFTTVGVIASTTYADVPGEIRRLFVEEQGSRLYIFSVIATLVFGVLLLLLDPLGITPNTFTVVVFALLVIFSVVSLGRLGRRLFNFFDLSSLSEGLPARFMRASARAAVSGSRMPSTYKEQVAHGQGQAVLTTYRQLTALLTNRRGTEPRSPRWILAQLIQLWYAYGHCKSSIPTHSHWFGRRYEHRSWLTLDESRLSLALATSTGVGPETNPDPLWVEREMASRISELLDLLIAEETWEAAIEIVHGGCAGLIQALARNLQVAEAEVLIAAVGDALRRGRSRAPSWPGALASAAKRRDDFVLAAAERETLMLTAFLIGLVRALGDLGTPSALGQRFSNAVGTTSAPYDCGLPRELVEMLERVAVGIDLERRAEGRRVTPDWWVRHYASREMYRLIDSTVSSFVAKVDVSVITPLEADPPGDPDVTAVEIFAAMELANKLMAYFPAVYEALAAIQQLRHDAAADGSWPTATLNADVLPPLMRRLERRLAGVLPSLSSATRDSSRPDLFGQAYKVVCDATFEAIIAGRTADARVLFAAVFLVTDAARSRLADELSRERPEAQLIYGTEPVVELMELSGYALLMQECDGVGVWKDVRTAWDAITSTAVPALPEQLVTVLDARQQVFGLNPGGRASNISADAVRSASAIPGH
jgi:hypothetical protein